MRKILLGLIALFCLSSIGGCSEKEKVEEGEFLLAQFGVDWKKETVYLVVPIQGGQARGKYVLVSCSSAIKSMLALP